jgi:hypothetical protein
MRGSVFRTRPVDCNLGQVEMREMAVFGKIFDSKINRFVFCLISEISSHQLFDHFDHRCDVLRVGCSRKLIARLMRNISMSSKKAPMLGADAFFRVTRSMVGKGTTKARHSFDS